MKFTEIDTRISKAGQTVRYLQHVDVDGRKVRIDIKTDSYKEQSHCRLDVFDQESMKWNNVVSIPPLTMETDKDLGYLPDIKTRDCTNDFRADRRSLLIIYEQLVA